MFRMGVFISKHYLIWYQWYIHPSFICVAIVLVSTVWWGMGEKAGVSLTGCNELQPTHDAMHEKIKSGKKNLFLHFYLTAYLPFRHRQQLYLTDCQFCSIKYFCYLRSKRFQFEPPLPLVWVSVNLQPTIQNLPTKTIHPPQQKIWNKNTKIKF